MTEALEKLLASAEQARREKRLADARHDALAAVALAEQADDSAATARAITLWARSERDLGDREVALRAYKKAATIYRDCGDALKLAHALRHLGDIHQDSKRPTEAEPLFREALQIYRAHPETPPLELANALRPLALLQHDAGNVDDADQLWEEAKNLYAQVNVLPGVVECAGRLALIARQRENPERARQMLAEASVAAQNSGDYNSQRYVNEVRTWISG
jgi:tetratricopeptide (TPR) repeat protein